ncbi:LysM peptidoglycan-binding domain-containing protein [Methylobacterium dankookense]|uniref:LysM domain-containing protein n=1 Tax=Methylobacterium dankookense TaxID=560405 RepID=A0A564G7B9_9HYPH|nr:LysM peptidoglycan-binding domain-containing protein [Methylobacterium dankookense]GJD57669.1 hypothetical protein IFDJLNFL_3581 [Methylobacterium dankookense]VUF15431.1 hypothetical protein MTDSW087_05171 [Methylobacterium dankookense]
MSTVLGRSLALAFGGLVAGLGLVLALFGGDLRERWAPTGDAAAPRTLAAPPAARPDGGAVAALPEATPPGGPGAAASPPAPAPTLDAPRTATNEADKTDPAAPSFDVVRVEPNGESVVAGRARPDSTVELLVDGKPVAQARADRDGQFAIVPPPLPQGSSEIVLRATGADGREVRSKQSVAVALPPTPEGKPLVALTAPDRPTAVLSQPEPTPNPAPDGSKPAKATPLRIVSVDAQESGRLFVSSEAPPGAAVRLYLNDTLIAPARAGADGKVTFTIGKGVRPGAYRIRVDQVDSETGKVRIRAEVPFTVPETAVQVAARSDAARPSAETAAPKPTETARAEAAKTEAAKSEAARPSEKARPQAAKPETAKPETGKSETGKPGSAASEPARPGAQAALPEAGRRPQAAPPSGPARPAQRDARSETPRPEAAPAPAGGARPAPSVGAPGQPAGAAKTADAAGGGAPQGAGSVFVPEINTARIERGNSLWQISRRAYGRGNRYTVIYDANQEQIRDPDLIYPGQIFVLPEDKGATGGATGGAAGPGGHKRG